MAFDPLEERRRREGMRGMLDAPAPSAFGRGGMLSAAGMPPMRPPSWPGRPAQPGVTNPTLPWPRRPGMTIGPSMPTVDYGSGPVTARPGTIPQKTPEQLYQERVWINDTQWHSPGRPDIIFGPPDTDASLLRAGMLDPNYSQSPMPSDPSRPDFVPADWVYIGNGDWGPPSVYGTEGPPLLPTGEAQAVR